MELTEHFKTIYDSDDVLVDVNDKCIRISYFKDFHYQDEEFIFFDDLQRKAKEK